MNRELLPGIYPYSCMQECNQLIDAADIVGWIDAFTLPESVVWRWVSDLSTEPGRVKCDKMKVSFANEADYIAFRLRFP